MAIAVFPVPIFLPGPEWGAHRFLEKHQDLSFLLIRVVFFSLLFLKSGLTPTPLVERPLRCFLDWPRSFRVLPHPRLFPIFGLF